jgi:putative transposase
VFQKKVRWRAVHACASGGVSVTLLCVAAGMSRENYYKQRRQRAQTTVDEQLVLDLVCGERHRQPRLGVRKLHVLIEPELLLAGVSLGRDRLFCLLKRHDLLVPRARRTPRTTNSRHGFAVYPNHAKDLTLTGPHQLWVSDITYLRTAGSFVYLALMMDAWSRAIVGYDCSNSLEAVGALRALSMGLKQLPAGSAVMHHSDRGIQYCCRDYIQRLTGAGVSISMTEQNHCYENSQAERLNGTLKGELGLNATFQDVREAQGCVREAVSIYNEHRPHQALGYRLPMQVHRAGQVKFASDAAAPVALRAPCAAASPPTRRAYF